MTRYEEKCEMCGDVIHTYEYESGYQSHSTSHSTVKPYEDRRISLPEKKDTLYLKVCMDCQKKEPSLHSLIKRKRIKWFEEEIDSKNHKIKRTRKQIINLENSIPKIKKEIEKLRKKKKQIEKGE